MIGVWDDRAVGVIGGVGVIWEWGDRGSGVRGGVG